VNYAAAALDLALQPIREELSHPQTEEICFNGPGEFWRLRTGSKWECVAASAMTYRRLHGIATLAAAQMRQSVGERKPLMSADMPGDLRLHVAVHPAVKAGLISAVIRRASDEVDEIDDIETRYDITRWNAWESRKERQTAVSGRLLEMYDAGDLKGFLRGLAASRRNVLIGASTGVGKTRFFRMFFRALPRDNRVVVIEDADEAVVPQPNHVKLFYSDNESAGVPLTDLMLASLRMRPDTLVIQEVRHPEAAWTLVNDVMPSHPGSPTTIHGRRPGDVARRIFNLMKASNAGKQIEDKTLIGMLASTIDAIIPLDNIDGSRSIEEVWFKDDAARRGESFAELLKD
jgi:type IV secretion system protein VirB11